jgi:oxalate decarboxylase
MHGTKGARCHETLRICRLELQQNFGLTGEAIANLPKGEPLYIFRSDEPVKSLEEEITEVARHAAKPKMSYTFKASAMKPTRESNAGSVKIIDSRNFPASLKSRRRS